MTDRYNALTVVLDRDIRDDDAECILNAIRMIKGVRSVTGNVADMESHIAEQRVRHELEQKLMSVLRPDNSDWSIDRNPTYFYLFMNQSKTKQLRKFFIAPFAEGDPRNRGTWRSFKREYNKMPRPFRAEFLFNLKRLKENTASSASE